MRWQGGLSQGPVGLFGFGVLGCKYLGGGRVRRETLFLAGALGEIALPSGRMTLAFQLSGVKWELWAVLSRLGDGLERGWERVGGAVVRPSRGGLRHDALFGEPSRSEDFFGGEAGAGFHAKCKFYQTNPTFKCKMKNANFRMVGVRETENWRIEIFERKRLSGNWV